MHSSWCAVGCTWKFIPSQNIVKKVKIVLFRKCLLLLNIIALIAGGFIYIPNFYTLLLFRFLQGFCVGAYSSVAPLIIKELSPTEISGTLGSYTQLLVTLGVFFGCIFKYILYKITGDKTGRDYWYITYGFT
jgi:MFS family permease